MKNKNKPEKNVSIAFICFAWYTRFRNSEHFLKSSRYVTSDSNVA